MINSKKESKTEPVLPESSRWTVTGYAGYDGRHRWHVRCRCGKIAIVGEYQLVKGLSLSCGCLKKDINRELNTVHGETGFKRKSSPEYRAYRRAKLQYEEFPFESFESFLAAVGRKPSPKHVLARIDREGNYEAGNLEWTLNRNRKN